jgi:hypothetical protein
MLTVGAAGVAGALAHPGTAVAVPAAGGMWTPVTDLGVAPANTPAANRAALVAALSNSPAAVYFPPGDYRVDNSGDDVVIAAFAGEAVMAPGARILFTDNTRRGLLFRGGDGARFHGLSTAFVTAPPSRVDTRECLLFDTTTDTYVEDVRIHGSAAAGLLFWRCVRPTVVGALITATMADGLHFANCQDGRADRITTIDTGDDGVAFLNYASGPAHTGGLATGISVTRSKSRGVSVVGQSGVTVRDAFVDTTAGPGLLCAYEANWSTRVPDDVSFERVRITAGGAWLVDGIGGNNAGLRITGAGRVTASHIGVDGAGAHGVHVAGSGTVTLLDITVGRTPGSGFLLQGGTHVVDRLTAAETAGIGFNANGCERLDYGTVIVRNTAKTHATHRAVNVENTARVYGTRVWVIDTQATITGWVVGAFGTQKGTLGTIVGQVNGRAPAIDNPSGLGYTLSG